jgi:hypothetical protein
LFFKMGSDFVGGCSVILLIIYGFDFLYEHAFE